ncbi:AbrB family transcriptional regulator [Streptococcus equi]|uniref:AbrB family transcriptional regulator n=1 Tax=Streptococcus equi TaxID=1336 RepID=UPI0013F62303|nr:AbrB family transcriptional regulator [Streptococcus equi]HEK9997933.1 AbrB family transcriptional regulator [Streptococcus equi subsp. zooepidemicus]
MLSILMTLFVGTLGGLVAKRLSIPAPFMIGSMVAVALASILTKQVEAINPMKIFAQIISGAYIGQSVSKSDLLNLPKLAKSIISLMSLFTLNMFLLGGIFVYCFDLDPVTALLSCLPGGIMDVSLIAVDMGAKADMVATLQSARLVGMLLFLPVWVTFWVNRFDPKARTTKKRIVKSANSQKARPSRKEQLWNNVQVLSIASIGGLIGLGLKIPVGALIVSLLFSTALKVLRQTSQMPSTLRYIAQVFAGSIIGTSFTQDSLLQMGRLIVPILLLLSSYLIINLFFGYIMYKKGILDLQSALFASSPAGATDISLLSGELGGDMPKIAGIQISRTLYTVVIMPLLVKWLISIW